MDYKKLINLFGLCASLLFINCQQQISNDEKLKIVNNHIENAVLQDIIEIFKDSKGVYPNKIEEIKVLYSEGEDYFGLSTESIDRYIKDPFSESSLLYYRLGSDFYIVYSVGPNGIDDNQGLFSENLDTETIVKMFDRWDDSGNESGDILIYYGSNR